MSAAPHRPLNGSGTGPATAPAAGPVHASCCPIAGSPWHWRPPKLLPNKYLTIVALASLFFSGKFSTGGAGKSGGPGCRQRPEGRAGSRPSYARAPCKLEKPHRLPVAARSGFSRDARGLGGVEPTPGQDGRHSRPYQLSRAISHCSFLNSHLPFGGRRTRTARFAQASAAGPPMSNVKCEM